MGFYGDRVLPAVIERVCASGIFTRWRERACAELAGSVVEIGFGSGANVPFYPAEVEVVYAVEPSARALALAAPRLARSATRVVVVGGDAQSIALADDSCDAALATFVLCTVPDPLRALAEVRRVVRPGGTLHFLEHGAAERAGILALQRVLDPLEVRLAGGCHLTRRPLELVRAVGLEVEWHESGQARGPAPWSQFTVGVARVP